MEEKKILAYAITHAPKGVKGGPYEGPVPSWIRCPSDVARTLADAERWEDGRRPTRDELGKIRKVHHHARVIRIVRKARLEVGAAKESAAFEAETWRDASAVEVLRDMLATWEARGIIRAETFEAARRVLAASGPDPSEVVRAALAWAGDGTRVIQARERDLFDAVDAYRKAGGK